MNKKFLYGIILVAVSVVFYIAGAIIGWPLKSNDLAGDIGKAKKTKNQVFNINQADFQEKLLHDTAFSKEAFGSISLMQMEAQNIEALLQISQQMFQNDSYLQSAMSQMTSMEITVHNINSTLNQLTQNMEALSKGEKVETFEQDFNNAVLSYTLLDRTFIMADRLSDILQQKEKQNESVSQELAFLNVLWNNAKRQHQLINNLTDDQDDMPACKLSQEDVSQLTAQMAEKCHTDLQENFVSTSIAFYLMNNHITLNETGVPATIEMEKSWKEMANIAHLKNSLAQWNKLSYFVVYNQDKLNAESKIQQEYSSDSPMLGAYYRYVMLNK